MINSKDHIELDGETYRLAESSDGEHYGVRDEPLRPPNAVTVQGESQQKFQIRPDILLWNWTDWSAGEGRRTLKFGESGRFWQGKAIRVFEEPGHLIPGWYVETTTFTGGGNFTRDACLGTAMGNLYAVARGGTQVHQWDGSNWSLDLSLTGGPANGFDMVVGDDDALYGIENGASNVYKWTGGASWSSLSTTLIGTAARSIAQLGPYLYVYRPKSATVWEISKSTGAITAIDEWTETGRGSVDGQHFITSLDGRIYVVVKLRSETTIREITPSSAAGTGFGAEVARIHGFQVDSIWSHSGALFMAGRYRDDASANDRTVLYLVPGGEYGSLGELRQGEFLATVAGGAGRMLDHFFVAEQLGSGDPEHALFQVDSVSGGLTCLAYDEVGLVTGMDPAWVTHYQGDIFWTTKESSSANRTLRADASQYNESSWAISSEHDFDLVDSKFLSSLSLSCEPLPANWRIRVDYMTDGDGTWTNVIDYTTTNGTGENQAVTTDASTVGFKRMQMRIRMDYNGGSTPSSAPVILGVEARAVASIKVKTFQFLIDLSSDRSAGKQSRGGATKIDTLRTTLDKETVMDLKDGYTSPRAGEYDQYDVFVEGATVILDRPGEGLAAVTLREVV